MEFISERVSVERTPEGSSIVITARLPRGKEAMLLAWFAAWTFCGVYFIYSLTQPQPPDLRKGLFIMLAFWAYFELRIGRVVLWRLKGFEIWRVKEGELTVKDSVFRYGKATRYFIENIDGFGLLNIDETSWKWQFSDSFWTRGAERLGFEHLGKKVAIGKGLSRQEAVRLGQLMNTLLKRERKVAVQ